MIQPGREPAYEPFQDDACQPARETSHETPHSPAHQRVGDHPQARLPKERSSRFGPSALATPANAITGARLLATPALVVLVAVGGTGWAPFAVALAVGATDFMDGWIGRRQGATRSGAFLDPLADKVAVLSVLFALAGRGEVGWLPVGLIAVREVAMSVYRSLAGRRGVSIPARPSAKLKAWVQGIAILLAITPPIAPHQVVIDAAMWVAVAFTLVTGVQYLVDGSRAARSVTPVGPSPATPDEGLTMRHGRR